MGATTPGNWDDVLAHQCYWGARYEGGRKQKIGMVPLSNYQFLTALKQRFHEGKQWEETEWLAWMRAKGPSRYNSEHKIKNRLKFIESLYEDCLSGEYHYGGEDLPLINVGRDGRIAIEDGRHRICVAKAAGIERILVRVNAVHPEHLSAD